MFKNSLKLAHKFLVLAILLGTLGFALSMNNAANAMRPRCCWECDAMTDSCDHICDFNPSSPGCALCQANITQCYVHCDPDPFCIPQ
jgi:hypothetical protein